MIFWVDVGYGKLRVEVLRYLNFLFFVLEESVLDLIREY